MSDFHVPRVKGYFFLELPPELPLEPLLEAPLGAEDPEPPLEEAAGLGELGLEPPPFAALPPLASSLLTYPLMSDEPSS